MEKFPHPLYPEKSSSNIAQKVEKITNILEGSTPTWEVTEAQRTEILTVEKELGTQLEAIFAISPNAVEFECNYFLTPEGRDNFEEATGISLPQTQDSDELKRFLYEQTEALKAVGQKQLAPLAGNSARYREREIVQTAVAAMADDGTIDTAHLPRDESISLRLTPELDFEKTKQLRDLKTLIKEKRETLNTAPVDNPDQKAMLDGIYELYQRKINEMIADGAKAFVSYQQKADFLGVEALSETEKTAQTQDFGSSDVDATLGRYDKFLRGSSTDSTPEGWNKQISTELIAFADKQEVDFLDNLLNQEAAIVEKGLDSDKLFASTITAVEVEKHCEAALAHYDLLSSIPASEYDPSRPGAAEDDKWQIIVSDTYGSLSVDGRQKVVKCPNKPQSADRLLGVSIAHEIEGHAIQHTNRATIPLQLFEKIGSDRSGIFAEAGAVSNEQHLKREAFGYQEADHPHYIRAMVRKLAGGNYADCLDTYYTSAIKGYTMLHERGELDDAAFEIQCIKQLEEAVNRTGRLFRGGASKTNSNTHLAESKAAEYTEQKELADALKANGLDQALNLTGVNLSTLEFLLKAKLLDLDTLKTPDFYSLQLWEEMKADYSLES